jgi:hypothetical protein
MHHNIESAIVNLKYDIIDLEQSDINYIEDIGIKNDRATLRKLTNDDEIYTLKQTINDKQQQINRYIKESDAKGERISLRNMTQISKLDLTQYMVTYIDANSEYFVNAILHLKCKNGTDEISYKENVMYDKCYHVNGNHHINDNKGIIYNVKYHVLQNDIPNFLYDNAQYVTMNNNCCYIDLPVRLFISF